MLGAIEGDVLMQEEAQATVRYWAAAADAAGVASESVSGRTLGEVLSRAAVAHPGLSAVFEVASYLVDGQATDPVLPLTPGAVVDVLPPFAGG